MLFNEQDGREAAPRGWSGTVIGWLAAITLVVGGANALAATDGATMIQAEPERALISIGSEQFKPLLPLGINRLHVDLDSPTAAQKATIQNQPEQIGVPRQIGFSRDIQTLGTPSDAAAALTWQSLPSGGQAASFSIASPDAQGIRVGLRIYALPDNAIVRFYASGAGSAFEVSGKTIVGLIAQNLAAGDGSEDANTYWSPVIDGIEAVVEIELPPGTPSSQVRLAVPKISHLVVSAATQAMLMSLMRWTTLRSIWMRQHNVTATIFRFQ